MEQYISKSALVEELEKRRDKNTRNKLNLAAAFEDNYLLSLLDSFEVKEIKEEPASNELKKESYWENRYKEVLKQFNEKEEKTMKQEEKELLLKDLEWIDMETKECHCYSCELFDSKNNVCKCIDLCKRPKSTYKGFYIK